MWSAPCTVYTERPACLVHCWYFLLCSVFVGVRDAAVIAKLVKGGSGQIWRVQREPLKDWKFGRE